MNERIYTLAEQVGAIRWNDELNGNSIDFSRTQFEKFAELIVRECIEVIDSRNSKQFHPTSTGGELLHNVAKDVKEHFGVEQ